MKTHCKKDCMGCSKAICDECDSKHPNSDLNQLKNRIATGMTTQNDVELLEQLLNNKQENK